MKKVVPVLVILFSLLMLTMVLADVFYPVESRPKKEKISADFTISPTHKK